MAFEILCVGVFGASLLVNLIVAVPALAQFFGQKTLKEISDSRPSKFTPAAPAIGIAWMVVYAAQIFMFVYAFVVPDVYIDRIWALYIIVCILNAFWCISFSRGWIDLSVVIHLVLWGFLFLLYSTLNISYFTDPPIKLGVYNVPFSLYMGWVTVALVANVFVAHLPNPDHETKAAAFAIAGLTIPVLVFLYVYRDYIATGAILFGVLGVLANRNSDQVMLVNTSNKIKQGTMILILGTLAMGIYKIFR